MRDQIPPTQDWFKSPRDQFRFDETEGFLDPAEGQKAIESIRAKAVELNIWDKSLEKIWPYPPIPWGFHEGEARVIPGNLTVQLPVTLEQSWGGFSRDYKLLSLRPPVSQGGGWGDMFRGFVADEAEWAKLWLAWRGEENLPKVDFEKDVVLVFAMNGLSKLRMPLMPLDENGNLTATNRGWDFIQGGDGFAYLMGTVSREKIESVNESPLGKR